MPAKTKKVATAKKPAAKDKMPVRAAADLVLLEEGRPMHYREISKKILERGLIKVKRGHKEEQTIKTVRSYLAGTAAEDVKFVRVDPGVFDLKERAAAVAKKVADKKKTPAAKKPATTKKG